MSESATKAAAVAAAVFVGTSILRHSRLARLAVVGGVVAGAYARLNARGDGWHEVQPPAA